MTTFDAAVSEAQFASAAPAAGIARFRGAGSQFWRLLAGGAVLLVCTLGIYRFWLSTDIRRFLWCNTEFAGESFEYIGTARELLLGFLIAIAILLPLYVGFFVLALGIGDASTWIALLVLSVLGEYASYRARRYRLTRTVYRGVRFVQSGSAWRYAVCALFWWGLVALTAGLLYPFAQSWLERFKMRHTFFGTLPGRFEGSGATLLLRGLALWLVAIVPLLAGAGAVLLTVKWSWLTETDPADWDLDLWMDLSGVEQALVYGAMTGGWLLLSIGVLYPVFQAIVLRWWVSGLSFGELSVTSRLRTGQVFRVYAHFLIYAFLFTLAAAAMVIPGTLLLPTLTAGLDSLNEEIITTVAGLTTYVLIALGYWTIYQASFKVGLWRCVLESLDVSNVAVLEHVSAAGQPASAVGEGLADALSTGGI